MSIELRISDDVECDWGVIEHGNPRPDREQVGQLMLATTEYVDRLLTYGPEIHHGAIHQVTIFGDRILAYVDFGGQRWTWVLHEAHWQDGGGPSIYVGRWPD